MLSILDKEDLRQLTGYVQPSDVAKCLRKHKIYYIEGKDGQIRTTNKWIEQAGQALIANDDGFDLDF